MYSRSVMIKAIIFDYNGVMTVQGLFDSLEQEYAVKQGKDLQLIRKIRKQYWDLARVGAISSHLFWENVARALDYDPICLRKEWIGSFSARRGMRSLAGKLRKRYKTALLTNEIRDWLEEEIMRQNLNTYFEVIFASYEAGVAKPDPTIFSLLLTRLDVSAQECIFIDDQEKNILAAQQLGFDTITFESLSQLQEELRQRWIQF